MFHNALITFFERVELCEIKNLEVCLKLRTNTPLHPCGPKYHTLPMWPQFKNLMGYILYILFMSANFNFSDVLGVIDCFCPTGIVKMWVHVHVCGLNLYIFNVV